jgi:CRP-like cAMP-binding protein
MEGDLYFYPTGTRLVTENEFSRKMFIVKRGKVRVCKHYMGRRVTLAVLGEGEVFGELSFFDAAPRSASVDALSDVEVIVIDGKKAVDQIASLPPWVVPIFKTVFHRFREADQKITVLQSMNELQKQVVGKDGVAQSIYLELLRFLRTFDLLHSGARARGPVTSDRLFRQLDEVLGKRALGLGVFWKVLRENDFIDCPPDDPQGIVVVKVEGIREFTEYLSHEVESDRLLLLSHSAVALLRKIVGVIFEGKVSEEEAAFIELALDQYKIHHMTLYEDSLAELHKHGILSNRGEHRIRIVPQDALEVFKYQSILKSFDHSSFSAE